MKRNRKFFVGLSLLAFAMFAFAFANVPLYRMVCQRLGIAVAPNAKKISYTKSGATGRKVGVRFSGLVAGGMPIVFEADEPLQTVEVGKQSENTYVFTNMSKDTLRFRPVHSVLPEDAAEKIQLLKCFCFNDQTLLPKQRMELPVIYTISTDLDSQIDYVTMNYTLFQKELDTK